MSNFFLIFGLLYPPPLLHFNLACGRLNSRRNSTCILHLPATAGKCQTEVQNILKPKVEFGVAKKCQFPAFLCNKKICQTKCQTEKVNYLILIYHIWLPFCLTHGRRCFSFTKPNISQKNIRKFRQIYQSAAALQLENIRCIILQLFQIFTTFCFNFRLDDARLVLNVIFICK